MRTVALAAAAAAFTGAALAPPAAAAPRTAARDDGPRLTASMAYDGRDRSALKLTIANTGQKDATWVSLRAENGLGGPSDPVRRRAEAALYALERYERERRRTPRDAALLALAERAYRSHPENREQQADDARCMSNTLVSTCELGPLKAGRSTSVVFRAEYADALTWRIRYLIA